MRNIINLPEDKVTVEMLNKKYNEYCGRNEKETTMAGKSLSDSFLKKVILGSVFFNGEVDFKKTADDLRNYFGDNFNFGVYTNAFNVVKDYVETGGVYNLGGTGLAR